MPTEVEYAGEEEIPEPPKLTLKGYLSFLFGAGIISLSLGIGTGEFISGPYAALSYGTAVLWITLVSILLQTITSIASTRYLLATGETLIIGISRLWPGRKFWAALWTLQRFFQLITPYYMMLTATVFVTAYLGRPPEAPEALLVALVTLIALAITILPLLFGERVVKTLGYISGWDTILEVLAFAILCVLFVPLPIWTDTFTGFFKFGYIPPGADWSVLAAIAGYAALTADAGLFISEYYRDLSWGMASKVGYISAIIGGKKVPLAARGFMPKKDPENIKRYNAWLRRVTWELFLIFALGSFITMWFPVMLYLTFVPRGAKLPSGWAFATSLAKYMENVFPFAFPLILLIGFAICWTNGIAVVDGLGRLLTSLHWTAFPSLSKRLGDPRKLYYAIIGFFTVVWIIVNFTGLPPLVTVLLAGSFSNAAGVLYAIGLLGVNRKLLPKEYRMTIFEEIAVIIALLFYGFFFINFIARTFLGIKF
jgi:hypothetical protein